MKEKSFWQKVLEWNERIEQKRAITQRQGDEVIAAGCFGLGTVIVIVVAVWVALLILRFIFRFITG